MYFILEVANTHGGDINYIKSLIDEYDEFQQNIGIKFQPFKYDNIACSDYEWFETYKTLFFSYEEWDNIIFKASKSKDIWLDIFDSYGIEVLKRNFSKVRGIKFQSSVLKNENLINKLKQINLNDKEIILNFSGYTINEIEERLSYFNEKISCNEIHIEIGFQSYPTKIEDSGISKIRAIRDKFSNKIVFADHSIGKEEEAIEVPLFAAVMGVEIIEKHIMHSRLETKYDYHSSITLNSFKKLFGKINKYQNLQNQRFINTREINYLQKTIQLPVLNSDTSIGSLIKFSQINYKRTNQKGLNYDELKKKFEHGYFKLNEDLPIDSTLKPEVLSKVKVGCIVAVRLKSTRLKRKALLKIGEQTSIELCLKNCLKLEGVDKVVMATSNLEEDQELIKYTYDKKVLFRQGHPENVTQRYLDIINELDFDVFVRVTGDMPYVSNDIYQFLLSNHFQSGADYTVARETAVGLNLEIINSTALRKVKYHFPNAEYSEYMTWYFQNNPEYFKLNFVDLPTKWVRDYRLTLDYEEDLKLFNLIESFFKENSLDYDVNILLDYLDSNPEISNINKNKTLKYKTDQKLIDLLNKKTKIK